MPVFNMFLALKTNFDDLLRCHFSTSVECLKNISKMQFIHFFELKSNILEPAASVSSLFPLSSISHLCCDFSDKVETGRKSQS